MKITKNKNKYFSYLQKQFSKLVVVLLVISMFVSFLNINQTYAYFSSSATVSGNTFTAGTLAFHLNPSTNFIPSILNKGDTASYSTTLVNDGSLNFQYTVETTNLNTDVDLCNALTLQATNGVYIYNDSLSSFSAPARSYDTSAWNFIVTLPSGVADTLQDKTCNFKFTFKGWQKELLSTQGFSDTKQISATITSGHWAVTPPTINPGDVVINEIMWMGSSASTADEWIELRNMTGNIIPIGGWTIEKAATSDGTLTIPADKTIAANGYFLIANYDKNNTSSALNISPDWVINLQFDNSNNGNVILKTSASQGNIIIDSALGLSSWPVGTNETSLKQSMERNINIILGNDGTLAGSWHTCIDTGCNSGTYWKTASGNNYGTPGALNLSTNDPTAPDYDPNFVPEEEIIVPEKIVVPEELPTATEEEITPTEEQSTEEVVVAEPVLEEVVVQEESAEEVTVVESVVEEVVSEPVVEEVAESVEEVVENI